MGGFAIGRHRHSSLRLQDTEIGTKFSEAPSLTYVAWRIARPGGYRHKSFSPKPVDIPTEIELSEVAPPAAIV